MGKLARAAWLTRVKPVQAMRATNTGAPIARVSTRAGVMRRVPDADRMEVIEIPRSIRAEVALDGEHATVVAVAGC